jgi:hypothetical protein
MVHDGAVVLERATNTRGSPANIGSGNSAASEVEGLMSNDDTSASFSLLNVKRILAACRVEQRVWMQLIFLLLGIGLLIPWNAFISAKAYFESRLCHETNQTQIMVQDNGSKATEPPPRRNLVSTFALVYNLSSVVTLTLIIAFQSFRDRYRRRCRLHRQRHSGEESGRTTAVEYSDNPLTQQASNNDDHAASSSNNRYSNRRIDADDAAVDGAGIDALSDRQTEFASSDEQNASRHHGTTTSNSFWLVVLPLSLYVAVFWNQAIMIWMIRIRHFWQWTLLGLVVCGMASGLAGAGIAASAGLYEASLAMNPYLTVRPTSDNGCEDRCRGCICGLGLYMTNLLYVDSLWRLSLVEILCRGNRWEAWQSLLQTLSQPRVKTHPTLTGFTVTTNDYCRIGMESSTGLVRQPSGRLASPTAKSIGPCSFTSSWQALSLLLV